jgi:hypothetical protein
MKSIIALSLVCIAFMSSAQDWRSRVLQFSNSQVFSEEYNTLLDYDDDGLKDVLLGHSSQRELFLYRNNPDHLMQMEVLTDTLFGVLGLHTLDYNNDGRDDFLIGLTTAMGNNLWLMVNQGQGEFTPVYVCFLDDSGMNTTVTADFDQDGDIDIVFDDFANSNVFYVVENNGDDTFNLDWVEYDGQPTGLFGAADLDADGDLDLLGTYFSFTQGNLVLVAEENLGGMEFLNHEGPVIADAFIGSIGDFSAGALPDLMLTFTSGTGRIVENLGNFTFSLGASLNAVPAYAELSPALDHDNDGDDDVLVNDATSLRLFSQNANSSFTASIAANAPTGRVKERYDFDQDGLLDLLTRFREVWRRDGATYSHWYNANGMASQQVVAAQISPEGNADIVTIAGGGQVSLFVQRFDEKFEHGTDLYITGTNITISTPFKEVESFDKDDDGDDDLLCVVGSHLTWLVNNNGTFAQQSVSTDANGVALWVGDLDNDGWHDILLNDELLRRREWNGNNYTTTSLSAEVANYYLPVDVDTDGDKDILYFYWGVDAQDYWIKYLRNNGNSFTVLPLVNLGDNFPNQFELVGDAKFKAVDLDQDGDEDMVFASGSIGFTDDSDFIAWLRNDGGGVMTPWMITDEVGQLKDFDVADFDVDGDLDIMSCFGTETAFMMHRNDGNENFAVEDIAIQASGPLSMRVVDMDNDADADVVFSSIIDRRVGWLENKANDCHREYSYDTVMLCEGDSVMLGNWELVASNLYADTLTSVAGCDSVILMQLAFYTNPLLTIAQSGNVLTATAGFSNYQWYLNDILLPGANELTLDAGDFGTGMYRVHGVSEDGCAVESAQLSMPVLIDVQEFAHATLRVYPIPTVNILHVQSTGSSMDEWHIYNLQGRYLFSSFPRGMNGSVDTSSLPAGNYILIARMHSGEQQTVLFTVASTGDDK